GPGIRNSVAMSLPPADRRRQTVRLRTVVRRVEASGVVTRHARNHNTRTLRAYRRRLRDASFKPCVVPAAMAVRRDLLSRQSVRGSRPPVVVVARRARSRRTARLTESDTPTGADDEPPP